MLDFDSLYRLYGDKIRAYIYRRTSDPYVADDLCHTTFLKAMEADRAGIGAHRSVSGWLYRIAHNLVIDLYRARDRRPEVELIDALPCDQLDLVEHAVCQERDHLLHTLMRRTLTEEQCNVVCLRYLEERTFDEIAEALCCTSGAVKARRHRGIENLRRAAAGYF